MKFSVRSQLLNKCLFRKNRLSYYHTLLKGVSEFLPVITVCFGPLC